MPHIEHHGWMASGEINWVENLFPDDIENILVDPEFDINADDSNCDEFSDEECEH